MASDDWDLWFGETVRKLDEDLLFRKAYDVYGAETDAELVLAFLRLMPRGSLADHLKSRRISGIRIVQPHERTDAMICGANWQGLLLPSTMAPCFDIDLLEQQSIESMALTVGHELGHTFFYAQDGFRMRRLANIADVSDREQQVCELFGIMWLEQNLSVRRELFCLILKLCITKQKLWFVE